MVLGAASRIRPDAAHHNRTRQENSRPALALVRSQLGNGCRRPERPLPSPGARSGHEIKKINLANGLVNAC
jgi:hypothetical protein